MAITLKHVSEAAGVSVQTVSQILNPRYENSYSADTRARVLAAVKQLGYRPNASARAMVTGQSHLVGVLVPIEVDGWFFQHDVFETMLGMNRRLSVEGYVTSVIPVSDLKEQGVSRVFREQLLDAVVVIGSVPSSVSQYVQDHVPVSIWCDTNVERESGCIRRDEFLAGQTVGLKIVERGYRRALWVTYDAPREHYSGIDRLAGFRSVVEAHRIRVELLKATKPSLGPEVSAAIRDCDTSTALVAENMHFAQAVINLAILEQKIAGRDFGLVACDHSVERAAVLPSLDHYAIERRSLGAEVAQLVLLALSSGDIPASQVVRGQWREGKMLPFVSR